MTPIVSNIDRMANILIHVDINKTLILGDGANSTTPKEDLRSLFAEHYKAYWTNEGETSCATLLRSRISRVHCGSPRDEIKKKQRHAVQNWKRELRELSKEGSEQIAKCYQAMLDDYQLFKQKIKKESAYQPWFASSDKTRDEFLKKITLEQAQHLSSIQLTGKNREISRAEEYALQIVATGDQKRSRRLFKDWKRELRKLSDQDEGPASVWAKEILKQYVQFKETRRIAADESPPPVIFPSFLKLIKYLHQKKLSSVIALRSFGEELKPVANLLIEQIARQTGERLSCISGHFEKQELYIEQERPSGQGTAQQIYRTPDAIFKKLASGHGSLFALQDNFNDWKEGGWRAIHGKLFPLNSKEDSVLSLYFDDGANRTRPEDDPEEGCSIVCPLLIGKPREEAMREVCSTIDDEFDKRIFQVDAIGALIDEDYFIKRFEQALEACSEFSLLPGKRSQIQSTKESKENR